MRYAFVERHRTVWPVRVMCRVMQVSHSGFYDWVERKPSRREQANRILKAHIHGKRGNEARPPCAH